MNWNSGTFVKTIAHVPRMTARGLIAVYRYGISGVLGPRCRHLPTCSAYGDEAITRFGLWAGGWMGLFRIARCGPGGTHGIDNVPERLGQHFAWYLPWRYRHAGRKRGDG